MFASVIISRRLSGEVGLARAPRIAAASAVSRGARTKPATTSLAFTYAQIAERLNQAKDRAALTAASKLIDTLADAQQRDELHEMAAHIDAELDAPTDDGAV